MKHKHSPRKEPTPPAERAEPEAALQRQRALQGTVSAISARFAEACDLDGGVDAALAALGRLGGADRACLFRFRKERAVMDNTHEWCADGIDPQMHARRSVSCDELPWSVARLGRGEVIAVQDVAKLPVTGADERNAFQLPGVKSLFVVPARVGGELAGFISLDNPREASGWAEDDLAVLRTASEIIALALASWRFQQRARRLDQELRKQISRRMTEAAESEQEYRALMENLNVGVFRSTPDGRCLRANPAMVEMFGYDSVEEFLKVPVVEHYVDPADRQDMLVEARAAGQIRSKELRQRRKDGSEIWCSLTESVRYDPDGRIRWLEGVLEDITDRKRAEEDLRRLTRFNQTIIDTADVWLSVLDEELNVVVWNRAAEQISGYPRDEAAGRREIWQRLYPDEASREEALAGVGAVADGHAAAQACETTIRTRGGAERTISWNLRSLPSEAGRRAGVVAIGRDVTDAKRTEEALRESETRYRLLAQNASDLIWTTDMELNFTYVSPAVRRMFGYTEEEALRLKVRDVVTPGGYELAARVTAEELQRERTGPVDLQRSRTVEVEHVRKDGSVFWAEVKATFLRDENNRPIGIEGVSRDITERRAAEETLREREANFRALAENVIAGIVVVGLTGRHIYANRRAAEIAAYSLEEFLQMGMDDVIAPEELPKLRKIHRTRVDGLPAPARHETVLLRKDGRRIVIEVSAARTVWRGDVSTLVMFQDVTERKAAEVALKQANRKLVSAREEERRRLAAELHDSVGQELVALKYALENTLSAASSGASVKAAGALAVASAQCQELIREVRNICQGLYPPTLESLGLSAALNQLVAYYQTCGVDVVVACEPDVQDARFDHEVEIALFRIVQEAVTNAVRHAEASHVEVGLRRDGDRLRLTVCDDGVGFDPARAADRGLGLGTMKQRANAAGGELAIHSRPGRTCIVAAVPIDQLGSGQQDDLAGGAEMS